MKSENVSEIDADAGTVDDAVAVVDAIADAVTGTESVAGIEAGADVAADVTDVATATDPGAAAVRILKTASCPSLSGKSQLRYSIGANTAGEIGFCITANSGGGLFNREWVPQSSIQPLLDKIPKGSPVRSSTLAPLFIHKSSNSPSFLLAALLSEGLLQALPDKARCYQLTDPTPFISEVNALLETPVDAPATDKPKLATSTKKSTLSLKHKSKKAA